MRRIIAIVTSVLAAGFVTGISAGPALAQSAHPSQICLPNPSQCMNNWAGHLAVGNPVNYYKYGTSITNNNWAVTFVETINTSCGGPSCQPFADGTGLNARYNGQQVYEFPVWGQTEYCAGGSYYNATNNTGQVTLTYCGSLAAEFVMTSYTALVAIDASNDLYYQTDKPNQPVWAGAQDGSNIGNGDPVWLSSIQSWNKPWGFY